MPQQQLSMVKNKRRNVHLPVFTGAIVVCMRVVHIIILAIFCFHHAVMTGPETVSDVCRIGLPGYFSNGPQGLRATA